MICEKPYSIKSILFTVVIGIMFLASALLFNRNATAESMNGLSLSDMQVRIASNGHTAVFRLYDTVGAKEFYDQLPLTLNLDNFRDAQWMFYPPEKLNVAAHEAYHDGKKGELSYYAPWGDVFMLYKDFYAGDEMHRLGVGISGIGEISTMSGTARIEKNDPQMNIPKTPKAMLIEITANGKTTVFKLNDSQASQELYAQLPFTIKVEDYGSKEKIFYPPKKLGTSNTPTANAKAGTLAYYAPWGDVVMFYERFGSASGLYELGQVVSGSENIKKMSGKIHIDKSTDQ